VLVCGPTSGPPDQAISTRLDPPYYRSFGIESSGGVLVPADNGTVLGYADWPVKFFRPDGTTTQP